MSDVVMSAVLLLLTEGAEREKDMNISLPFNEIKIFPRPHGQCKCECIEEIVKCIENHFLQILALNKKATN